MESVSRHGNFCKEIYGCAKGLEHVSGRSVLSDVWPSGKASLKRRHLSRDTKCRTKACGHLGQCAYESHEQRAGPVGGAVRKAVWLELWEQAGRGGNKAER